MESLRKRLYLLTPISRSDVELKKYLNQNEYDEDLLEEYELSLSKYRVHKALHYVIKILFYAGIITSVAATLGLDQLRILTQVASYIGVTVLFILFALTLYFSELHREEYHVKREILLSNVD